MDSFQRPDREVPEQVPNVRPPELVTEARRQSRAVAESPVAADDQAFVDAFNAEIFRGDNT
jgi:Protein  of unknown function (DUF3018)